MEDKIKNSNIYKRLQELRVDFAYSKNLFFAASDRVSKNEKSQNRRKNSLEIASILISVITLSSVAVYFSEKYQEQSIIVIGVLSILEIAISVYLLTLKNENLCDEYRKTADGYLDLYKKAKIIEAKVEDNVIGMVELSEKVEELTYLQSKLSNPKLTTTEDDFKIAKANIDNGTNTYSETDFEKT
ncbi:hypothetical protein NACSLCCMFF_320038 [Tenacibaculum maritimum]|uniref:hypothetical protein n=1 Tax=Tenacibaculum maritimum TaxID=107401 RepID=UPI0012E5F66B|nr:hypothetical protein [Tenacibaculum maritimum]CAA0209343.1 hypothetical protein NACSLCCMFF_320038 [Tenacibaculum maritimum]